MMWLNEAQVPVRSDSGDGDVLRSTPATAKTALCSERHVRILSPIWIDSPAAPRALFMLIQSIVNRYCSILDRISILNY